MAKEQKLARQSLSDFAYKNLYLPASNAQRLKKNVNDGDTAVCPVTKDFGECKVHIIQINGRCDCNDRIEIHINVGTNTTQVSALICQNMIKYGSMK